MTGAAAGHDPAAIPFVCPSCKGGLDADADSHTCRACDRNYPILFGIPDFRLRPDRYLTLEQERAKARRLHEFGATATFDELVGFYYSITDDVPPDLARVYQDYIRRGPARGRQILADLAPAEGTLLDIGCGSGGLLVAAAGQYRSTVGVDIALRWLVICQKQLADRGIAAHLVCADAESLPFPTGCATQVVAADLIEHVHDVGGTLAEIGRTLAPGGKLWLSAANRFCPGPHASTRIWAIGFLPRRARSALLRAIKGVDLLRFTNMVSPGQLTRELHVCGLAISWQQPKPLPAGEIGIQERPVDRYLKAGYRLALRAPALNRLLLRVGPAFEMLSVRGQIVPKGSSTRNATAPERP